MGNHHKHPVPHHHAAAAAADTMPDIRGPREGHSDNPEAVGSSREPWPSRDAMAIQHSRRGERREPGGRDGKDPRDGSDMRGDGGEQGPRGMEWPPGPDPRLMPVPQPSHAGAGNTAARGRREEAARPRSSSMGAATGNWKLKRFLEQVTIITTM